MGRVSSPNCRGSHRNNFLLTASLCQASLLKVAGLGLVEAKRRLLGQVGIYLMGGHVVAADAGEVAEHARAQ